MTYDIMGPMMRSFVKVHKQLVDLHALCGAANDKPATPNVPKSPLAPPPPPRSSAQQDDGTAAGGDVSGAAAAAASVPPPSAYEDDRAILIIHHITSIPVDDAMLWE